MQIHLRYTTKPGTPPHEEVGPVERTIEVPDGSDISDILEIIPARGLAVWEGGIIEGGVTENYKESGKLDPSKTYNVSPSNIKEANKFFSK